MSKAINDNIETINPNAPIVLVAGENQTFCNTLCTQLQHLGYHTQSINDLSAIEKEIDKYQPKVIFIDIALQEQFEMIGNLVKKLFETEINFPPIIYISEHDNLEARLDAVRNYSTAFLNKSFRLVDLKNILESLAPIKRKVPYKVLVIDDDAISSAYCTAILEKAGINVSCVDKPENVFEYIVNADPDAILLDMYMPNINGFEMASVIRQHQNFSTTPIIIMSSETDINKQFKMRRAGADDFILKPFEPHHLVDTVHNRIQRTRQNKRLIYTDGLTGLMLLPKVKDQVLSLLESCVRYHLFFSVASIDIDHFKQVNDMYGHLTGDQLLRNFSEFLLSRVRKSDMVIRAGGDEFIIILPYTSGDNALRALNSIRDLFSQRIQHYEDKEFKVSFSAGIASTKYSSDLEALLAEADAALYRAKENGRNHIELSS